MVPVGVYEKVAAVQVVVDCGFMTASGALTVTVSVKALPVQLPDVGVTV